MHALATGILGVHLFVALCAIVGGVLMLLRERSRHGDRSTGAE
jgi:uncharacterized membrane protein